jgi:hypothetical protein
VYLSCKLTRVGNDQLARLFVKLMKSSFNTFLNARTFPDKVASMENPNLAIANP